MLVLTLITAFSLSDRGQQVYTTRCVSCHNPNPSLPGVIGPALKGSSRHLLYLKVVKGKYPAGYKPRNTTNIMPVMPSLYKDIPAIEKYINK